MSAYLSSKHDDLVLSIFFEGVDYCLAYASRPSNDCNNDHCVLF
jgi:hypothetical protein